MSKKLWIQPMTLVQKFEANETVASQCFQIKCESYTTYYDMVDESNPEDYPKWESGQNHGGAIWFAHNKCHEFGDTVLEYGDDYVSFVSEKGGNPGHVDSWIDVNKNNKVDVGDRVYWYTKQALYKWNHWGTIASVDPIHPNRS